VIEAPAPSRVIERGLAGPGLLAHVIVSKFSDHLPLYRQSEIYARQVLEIPRSTLAGWVSAASDLLSPPGRRDPEACARRAQAARRRYAHARPRSWQREDQDWPPLDFRTRRQTCWRRDSTGSLWFKYSEDRKGEHPRQHLKNFKGALQADAYAGFHHLYGNDIYEAACWAHARRKFHEIHVIHASPTITEALARIGTLYAIEEEIRGKPADIRLNTRQSRATPLLDELRTWMEKALRSLSSKSETAGANRYALSRWRALIRYDRRQYAGDR
jgi:hypothetical protein